MFLWFCLLSLRWFEFIIFFLARFLFCVYYFFANKLMKMAFKIRDVHWEVILEYMSNHIDFARGPLLGAQGRETQKKMWLELANHLNSLGLGEKSADKWQKTWTDMKYQIKKKGGSLRTEQNATGGGAPSCPPFNSIELRAVEILGGKEFYAGVGSKEVVGNPVTTAMYGCKIPNEMPSTSKDLSDDILLEATSSGKGKNVLQTIIVPEKSGHTVEHDHIYDDPPPKRLKSSQKSSDDAYEETILILKEIKNSLDSLKTVVNKRLEEIAEAIRQIK